MPDDAGGTAQAAGAFDFLKNWRRDSSLLGDMWDLRTELARHGISFAVEETSEALGNVAGSCTRTWTMMG